MPSLILITEGCERHFYPLGKATLLIGRRDDSDIRLPSEVVSHDHASIILEKGSFVLHDNGSSNGSFINGEQVSKQTLRHLDLVRFGEYLFLVDLEGAIPKTQITQKSREIEIEPSKARPENTTSPSRQTSQKIAIKLSRPVNLSKQPEPPSKILGSL